MGGHEFAPVLPGAGGQILATVPAERGHLVLEWTSGRLVVWIADGNGRESTSIVFGPNRLGPLLAQLTIVGQAAGMVQVDNDGGPSELPDLVSEDLEDQNRTLRGMLATVRTQRDRALARVTELELTPPAWSTRVLVRPDIARHLVDLADDIRRQAKQIKQLARAEG